VQLRHSGRRSGYRLHGPAAEQLSPGCRAFFREPEPELTLVATRKPLVIKPRKAGKARKPHKPH
jgi:hypothetical protein